MIPSLSPGLKSCYNSLIKVDTQKDGVRKYHCFNKEGRLTILDSVTTIIAGSCTQQDAISLANAKKKWNTQYSKGKVEIDWEEYCQQARDNGSNIHKLIECYFKGEQNDKNFDDIPSKFKGIVPLIKNKIQSSSLIASEFFVYNPDSLVPYAGRADLYVKHYGQKYLVDIKTSNNPKTMYQWSYNKETKKRSKEYASWYEKAVLQLTAYELAMEAHEEYPEALGIWVIHPEGLDSYTIDIPKKERIAMWEKRQEMYLSKQKNIA